jgi:hypothetical protein
MSSTTSRASLGAFAIILCSATVGRADLFATMLSGRNVLRLDSVTGDLLRTYEMPAFISGPTSFRGMGFDGRFLYLTRTLPGPIDEVWTLDVVDDVWYFPSTQLETFPSEPNSALNGLGVKRGPFGLRTLLAVGRVNSIIAPPPPSPQSYLFEYPFFFPGLPGVIPNANIPPGTPPVGLDAQGADVDPATGDFWIAGDEVNSERQIIGHTIMRVALDGTVLQSVTPQVDDLIVTRGLAFDRGSLFIAGRAFGPEGLANRIYEIDRATGEVLNSFPLPISGQGPGMGPPVSALTGGEVVPEPSSAAMTLVGLVYLSVQGRRRRQPS